MKKNDKKQEMKRKQKVSQNSVLIKGQVLKRELEDVHNDIVRKIENSVIGIPDTIIPLLSEKDKCGESQVNLSRLIQERRKLEDKLKDMGMVEKELSQRSRVRRGRLMQGSRYTTEQKMQIKKLYEKMRDFDRSIEQKDRKIEGQKIRVLQQDNKRDRRQKQQRNKIKKIGIQGRLRELKERMVQREILKKQTDSFVKKVEQGEKKYVKMNEQWECRKMCQEQKKYEIMELRMKQKNFDFNGLKQHEKKYQEAILGKKKELEGKRLSASQLIFTQNRSMSNLKTRFHYILEEQERQAKEEEEERKEKQKFLHEKRIQYSEYVRDEFIPRKKEQQSTLLYGSNCQEIKIQRKTDQEIKEIGNQNLVFGNKKTKKKKESFISSADQIDKSNVSLPVYHDYLKQIHKKRGQTKENNVSKSQILNVRKEAQKIMNDNCLKSQDKMDLMKQLVLRVDEKGQDMVENIQNKLLILSALR